MRALSRVTRYMAIEKNYNQLFLWHSIQLLPFIEDVLKLQEQYKHLNMHERCLGLKYKHKKLSYEKLLEMDESASVLQKNIQVLTTET